MLCKQKQKDNLIKKMAGEQQGDAQQKFWSNQDLVEKLLPFLDAQSTLCLVQSEFSCTLDILQDSENPSIWIKLIGRSLTGINEIEGFGALFNVGRATFEEKREQVVPLIAILKLMKDANPHILNLLEAIIQKYQDDLGIGVIQMTCPCTTELHSVNLLGFLLLEEVELAFGSAQQEIRSLEQLHRMDGPCLAAMASRESRQQGKMTRFILVKYVCIPFLTHFFPG